MTDSVKKMAQLFAENMVATRGKFYSRSTIMKQLAALLYAARCRAFDGSAVEASYQSIRANTGAFSVFRGNAALAVSAMISLSDNGDQLLKDALCAYAELKNVGFRSSDYLAIAALQIALNVPAKERDDVIGRAKAFYDGMKSKHLLITGQDDYIYAAMLGMSKLPVEDGLLRIERIFQSFKGKFSSANNLQVLSEIMVIGGEEEASAERLYALRDIFKDKGLRMDKTCTLPSLGVLALLPVDGTLIAQEVEEVHGFLEAQKGLGKWSISKQQRLLLASSLVAYGRLDDMRGGIATATLSATVTGIVIAQEAAMVAIIASSASASS